MKLAAALVLLAVVLTLPQVAACADPLPGDPAAIRNELRTLRKRAAENNPQVRARIEVLLKQLQKLQAQRDAAESQARGEEKPAEEEDKAATTRETMFEQVGKMAAGGKGAKADLAEPVRKAIVEEYEEDRDHSIKNPSYYQAVTMLVIDFSRKEASLLIDNLERFTSIETLVLTGGDYGAPVDLLRILDKAKTLPLEELYIFNFRGFLSSVPASIATFTGLRKLSLFNNAIKSLPAAVGELKRLQVLHVDMNPIATVFPVIGGLPALAELGIGRTGITEAEQGQIAKLLPNCRIVTQ